jgi:hypothetical protein
MGNTRKKAIYQNIIRVLLACMLELAAIPTSIKKNILPNQEVLDSVGYLQAETVNEKDYISSRTVSFKFKGPAVSVYSLFHLAISNCASSRGD